MDNRNLTPASHWKRNYEEGMEIEMPSGAIVRMRPTIDVTYLIATGAIPEGLTAIAMEGLNFDTKDKDAVKSLSENIKRLNELYQVVCTETWIHPRIVANPQADNEIAFNWITKEDKDFTWQLVNQPVSEWKRFLQKWRGSVELVPNGTADAASTKQVAKSKPVG
jgi:hypothetical protein